MSTRNVSVPSNSIGIANLPNQLHKIILRKGVTMTIMMVGASGSGKTTFINTLLTCSAKNYKDPSRRKDMLAKKTTTIDVVRIELEEKGFAAQINIVDTPGFGDYVNNSECWEPIVEFLDGQHELYLKQEIQPHREDILDGRVHACIYFITPSGHTLRPLDIEAMKALGKRANLIPIISKSDTLSPNELAYFKRNIRNVIAHHDIQVYQCYNAPDSESAERMSVIDSMPFAIVGSEDDCITADGRTVKGRQYPWGTVEVDNEEHCDFRKLRNLLFRTHMLDLITTTSEFHYENFRTTHLDAQGRLISSGNKKVNRFKEEEDSLRRKFTEQVKSKEAIFRQWEQRLIAERDKLNKDLETEHGYITQLTAEIKALEERLNFKK